MSPSLPKLNRPYLVGGCKRERLFRWLDLARERHRGIFVLGPPGAGKTSLLASWLDHGGSTGIWYHADPGDADPAAFFYYLGQAALPYAKRGQRSLPVLTPEHVADVAGFGRRFFRDLFGRLPAGSVLTVDNYQEIHAQSPLHRVVAAAIEEVPAGCSLVLISRTDPPAELYRLRANRMLAVLGWEALRLTRYEAEVVASQHRPVSAALLDQLHEQCDGWAAGLILMLESVDAADRSAAPPVAGRQAVFDYFAGLIFQQAPEPLRRMLLSVAFLPYVTAGWAFELSGEAGCDSMLDEMCRRHFFTQRRRDAADSYQFHALFRAFLVDRVRRTFVEGDYRQLILRSSRIVAGSGASDVAFELLCEAQAWEESAQVLLDAAPGWMHAGRYRTLSRAISSLPSRKIEQHPWLRYWQGLTLIPESPEEAMRLLMDAYEAFTALDDVRGRCLCAAGVLDAIVSEWRHQGAARQWIEILCDLSARDGAFADDVEELRTLAALVIPCVQTYPGHPALARVVARVLALAETSRDSSAVAWAMIGVLDDAWSSGRFELAYRARERLLPVLAEGELAPVLAARAWRTLGLFAVLIWDGATAKRHFKNAMSAAQDHGGLERQQAFLASIGLGYLALAEADGDALKAALGEARRMPVPDLPGFRCLESVLVLSVHALRGELEQAIGQAHAALVDCDQANVHFIKVTLRAIVGDLMLRAGDFSALRVLIDALHVAVQAIGSDNWYLHIVHAFEFTLAQNAGDMDRAHEHARESLRRARDRGLNAIMAWTPTATTRLCAYALERGIEPEHARALISSYRLRPEAPDLEHWPWPLRVRTLGIFDISLNGRPPNFARKAPKRLLQLLAAIVAQGGIDVPAHRLADQLWSEEDADVGMHAFHAALARLRTLLGDGSLLTMQDSKVSFDLTRCWIDAYAFENLARQAGSLDVAQLEQACSLYQGPFLGNEPDSAWALPIRERLRSQFVSCIQRLGKALESEGHWDRAASWYQRGVDADPLMEALHQELIRCYARAGRPAEAIGAYRRLRDTLSVVLGIAPSPASEALYAELYGRA